ncbi:hypothetical protein ACFOJE_02035 [Azotobacter bryophylli]|uniref:Uncharacterized protein n=1 Tax=Azotobacter bryophylli TaxID=1986537 RepID=A0ABV7APL6_9GAMM
MRYNDTPEGKRRAKILASLGFADCAIEELEANELLHLLAKIEAVSRCPDAAAFVDEGFKLFQAARNAETSEGAVSYLSMAFGQLASAIVCMRVSDFRAIAEQQASRMRPLAKIHEAKSATIERAQAVATELWQADTAQEIRLGDMADRVYRALAADDFAESLPGSAERIKEWIKPAAPEYARKGGRRRKTP